jgi:hypothetical protein
MKSLNSISITGKLTQRERVLLLKHTAVAKELKGELVLTAGVFNPVLEWKPKDGDNVSEYNKYIEASNLHLEVKLQLRLMSKDSEIMFLEIFRVIDALLFGDIHIVDMMLRKISTTVDDSEATDIVVKNSGLEYEKVVNKLSFEYLPIELKEFLLTDDGDIITYSEEEMSKEWTEANYKATELVKNLVDIGKLQLEDKENYKIITGESLFKCEEAHSFIAEYKRQIEYFKMFGSVLLFLKEKEFIKCHTTFISFRKLFIRLSDIFEIGLEYTLDDVIKKSSDSVQTLNAELIILFNKLEDDFFVRENILFPIKIYLEKMLFNEADLKPDDEIPIVKMYNNYLDKIFHY